MDVVWNEGQLVDFQQLDDLFLNKSQGSLLINSLLIGCGTTVLTVLIGVPFAFVCERTAFPVMRFFRLIYLIPILIPPYIHAIVWTDAFATHDAVNQFFAATFGFSSVLFDGHSVFNDYTGCYPD